MLPSTSPREALAFPPSPPWNLPSFTVESTLSSPFSHSDPPSLVLLRCISHLTVWCFGHMALFLLAKAALAYLPTALFVALRHSSQQALCVQVFPLKPVPFCTLFAGLGSTNKSATSLLSDSRSVLTILPSGLSFLLPQSLCLIR